MTNRMKVLISGAGIAGPCLAFWLERYGFEPTLVERAPAPRIGGYVIDFWGAAFDVAERMGLVSRIMEEGYRVRELRQVNRHGKRVSGFRVSVFDRMTRGRYTSLPRSGLASALLGALPSRVETIFGDSIQRLEDTGSEVRVHLERGDERSFDLVVGADGLHSQVRRLVFGDEARFERYLGMKVAAAEVDGYPSRDELVFITHREVGGQVGRFAMRNNRTLFLFIFRDPDPEVPNEVPAQKAAIRRIFSAWGWECAQILDALDGAATLYLDRVSQIHMENWSKGRTVLVGDAAFCPSFLAGQGSALAMIAAYILAGELKQATGSHEIAFARYSERLRTFVAGKQNAALGFASFFAPRSGFGLFLGDQVMKLMALPFVSELAAGAGIRDRIELPAY
jgi:2-polyprenyl-6-methoxyphenol hydroxylase-like FAD-dependent oxidoreductase